MRRARIKAAVGPAREARDFAEGLLRDRLRAFLEHESRHTEKPKLAGGLAEIVKLLFHRIADKNQRLYFGFLGLALGMRDDLADLRVAAAAVDSRHQVGEFIGLCDPAGGTAFAEAAVIDELHIETADRRRLPEHVGLQPAGGVPGRLPAHGGVERKDEPAA